MRARVCLLLACALLAASLLLRAVARARSRVARELAHSRELSTRACSFNRAIAPRASRSDVICGSCWDHAVFSIRKVSWGSWCVCGHFCLMCLIGCCFLFYVYYVCVLLIYVLIFTTTDVFLCWFILCRCAYACLLYFMLFLREHKTKHVLIMFLFSSCIGLPTLIQFPVFL